MQTVHAILRLDRLPRTPVTVRFEFTTQPKIYWLVFDGPQAELCFYDPGREAELVVTVNEQVFGGVLLGRLDFGDAVQQGAIRLDGPPELVRAFPTWLGVTRFAKYATRSGPLDGSAARTMGPRSTRSEPARVSGASRTS